MVFESNLKKYIGRIFRLSYGILKVPCRWDPAIQRFCVQNSRWRNLVFGFNVALYVSYELFVFYRLLGLLSSQQQSNPHQSSKQQASVANMGYNFFGNLLPMVLLLGMMHSWGQHAPLFNAALQYYKQHTQGDQKEMHVRVKSILYLTRLGAFIVTMNCLNLLRKPGQHHLLTSLMPEHARILRFLVLPIHLYIWLIQWSAILFTASVLLVTLKIVKVTAQGATYREQMSTSQGLELGEMIERRYLQNQILIENANAVFRWVMLGVEVVVITLIVVCANAVKRSEGILAVRLLITAVAATGIILAMFSNMAEVHEKSEAMMVSWARLPRQDAWTKRFRRSVRPYGIRLGSYFTVDKGIVLTLASIIIDQTVTVLMAT